MITLKDQKKMRMRWLFLASAFALSFAFTYPVQAQTGDLDARLARMERDLETLSRSVFKGERPPAGSLNIGAGSEAVQEQTEARLMQFEADLRDLTGRVEEQGNTLNQINRTLGDVQMRLHNLEQKSGGMAAVSDTGVSPDSTPDVPPSDPTDPNVITFSAKAAADQPPASNILVQGPNGPASVNSPTVEPFGTVPADSVAATSVPPESDPAKAYENAISLLKQRDYVLAEKSFTEFLKDNPKHNLAPNAKYWLGEAYFAQNKYEQAARAFAEGYQQYPKGAKAPDNLLKLGLSLSAMKNRGDACVAFAQIAKDFPNGAAAVRTRAEQEIRKLKCTE